MQTVCCFRSMAELQSDSNLIICALNDVEKDEEKKGSDLVKVKETEMAKGMLSVSVSADALINGVSPDFLPN